MTRDEWSTGGKSRLTRKNSGRADNKKSDQTNSRASQGERNTGGKGAGAAIKRSTKERGIAYLTFLLIMLLAVGLYIGFKLTDNLLAVDNEELLKDDTKPKQQAVDTGPKKRDVFTVLLIGIDQRENEAARGDTNILAVFDKKTKEVHLVSLPRDTLVQIPGKGNEKLGHAYAYGKGDLTKQTVENLLGIEIDGYISTNFNGFARIVDVIGGIQMEVEKRMYYPEEDIDLHPGKQKLDGHDALAYVRYRSDGRGDLGRMERQQKFLKILAGELMSVSTVPKIPTLVKEFNNNVKTDLGVKDMTSVANLLLGVDLNNIDAITLPGDSVYIKQVNYWQLDKKATQKLLEEFYFEPEEEQ